MLLIKSHKSVIFKNLPNYVFIILTNDGLIFKYTSLLNGENLPASHYRLKTFTLSPAHHRAHTIFR